MTAGPPVTPPRPSHGCLWGCLGVLAFLFLPVLLAAGYGGWFLYQGYRHDPVLRAVGELVRQNGMAEQVLGKHIRITGIEGSAFSVLPGVGESGSYRVRLAGSRGTGTLDVDAHTERGHLEVAYMLLTGPDGGRYDLLHHTVQPPPDTRSI